MMQFGKERYVSMKNGKRWLAGALAGFMLIGTLASCANTEQEKPADDTKEAISQEESTNELRDWLPDGLTYNGDEIRILSRYREGWTSGEIAVEKSNGEAVNDAVYERNKIVEDRLGVKIQSIEDKDANPNTVIELIKKEVSTGGRSYDIVASACYAMLNQSLNGTFANLRSAEYIDFDKVWWSQGFNDAVEYKGQQFGVTGSVVLSMYRFAFATMFNKGLFKDANVPYLYDNVRNGTWTLDYQYSIVTTFHKDNGNGVQDEKGDVYGLVSGDYISVDPYWSSCDIPILSKDENGDYVLVFTSDRLHSVCEKLMTMYFDTNGAVYNITHYGLDEEQNDIRTVFADGNAAMATMRLMELESAEVRDMPQEYGVVPMPKFDEEQQEYKTLLHDQFTVLSVPTTITGDRLSEVSAVMEALCSESYKVVKPAYYDTTLRTKLATDPDSAEMLDLLIDHIYIDAGIIYTSALSNFHDGLRKIMVSKKNTVISSYKATMRSAEKSLKKITKQLDKLIEMSDT